MKRKRINKLGVGRDSAKKVDNNPAAEKAKLQIRNQVLEAMPKPRHVFDAFAGSGQMFAGAWSRAEAYCGCDQKYIRDRRRLMYVADNRRVLRSIDLRAYNVFDLDAYGIPWEQAVIIADRRPVAPAELIGFAFTDGAGLSYKANNVPGAVQELAQLNPRFTGLNRWRDQLTNRTIAGLAERMRCEVLERWEAHGKTGMAVAYIGVVFRGLPYKVKAAAA